MTLLNISYLLIPASAGAGGLLVGWLMRRDRLSQRRRDSLCPVPAAPLYPLNETRWTEMAAELGCTPDELTDYARRIASFIVRELRWGGTLTLERPHTRPAVLIFDRFEPILGIDFPPAPKEREPLSAILGGAELES